MILTFVRNLRDWLLETYKWGLYRLKTVVSQLIVLILVFVVLLWMAVFLYGSFYFSYMPTVSYVKPVHLKFNVCEDGVGICSFPSANLSLRRNNDYEVFKRGQAYKILMELELPESPVNRDIGMFMVHIDLYDITGKTVQFSSQSSMLHYKSTLLRTLEALVFSPLFLFDVSQQKQLLVIEFYSDYMDNPYRPAVGAVLSVHSKKIQIYSSTVKIYAMFTGLRYIMFHWPFLSAIFGIGFNLFFLSAIATLSWYSFLYRQEDGLVVKITSTKKKSLEERRRDVKAMLDREKEARRQQESISNTEMIETVHPLSNFEGNNLDVSEEDFKIIDKDDQEETVVLSSDISLLESIDDKDTNLRLRHQHKVD